MKKTTIIAVLVAAIGMLSQPLATASALGVTIDQPTSQWTPSGSVKVMFADKYLASCGAVFYNRPVMQVVIFVSVKNGLYLDLWNSTPINLSLWDKNFGTEQDISVGWAGKLSKLGVSGWPGSLTLDTGVNFWDEPSIGTFGKDDILNEYIKVTKDFEWVSVSAKFECAEVMPNSIYGGGQMYTLEVSKSKSFFNDMVLAGLSADAMYDSGRFGAGNGFIVGGSGYLQWKLYKGFALILPQVNLTEPINTRDSRKFSSAVSGGLKWRF